MPLKTCSGYSKLSDIIERQVAIALGENPAGTEMEVKPNHMTAVFKVIMQLMDDAGAGDDYQIGWERNWQDMAAYSITPVVLLGATHVLLAEVTLVDLVTNGYHQDFGVGAGIVLEEIADSTNRFFYRGSRAAILSYLLQIQDQSSQRIYELYNFSLFDDAKAAGLRTALDDILGAVEPVELEQAHVTLVQAIIGANILR